MMVLAGALPARCSLLDYVCLLRSVARTSLSAAAAAAAAFRTAKIDRQTERFEMKHLVRRFELSRVYWLRRCGCGRGRGCGRGGASEGGAAPVRSYSAHPRPHETSSTNTASEMPSPAAKIAKTICGRRNKSGLLRARVTHRWDTQGKLSSAVGYF